MQLISQRVAAGLEIKPAKPIKRDRLPQPGPSVESLPEESKSLLQTSESPIDWKKWGNRVALGKSVISDIARFKIGNIEPAASQLQETHSQSPRTPFCFGLSTDFCIAYPCSHRSAPGLITLTGDTMFFTPLLSNDAKITIALTAIKGVKKVGMLKGLQVMWNDISGDKEDNFLWIGERDDLFARLVGFNGRRWIQI